MPDTVEVGMTSKGKLAIRAPFRFNSHIRAIPARLNKNTGIWTAPFLRGSIRAVEALKKFPDTEVRISPAAQKAIDEYEARLKIAEEGFPPRYVFKTEPLPHQRRTLDFIWPRKAAALGLAMGVGKSKISIDTGAARYLAGQIQQMGVICPASLVSTWCEEVVKHCPIKAKVYIDLPPAPEPDIFQIYIASVEGLGISIKSFEKMSDFVMRAPTLLVCDESSYIKEQSAIRSQRAHLLGGAAEYRMILNGTLIGNSPLDLWSQYEFIDRNIIGQEWYDFRAQHAIMGGFEGKQVLGTHHMEEVIEAVAPWTIIIKKSEVLKDLPPKLYEHHEITTSTEQKALIKEIKSKPLHIDLPADMAPPGASIKTRMALERILRQSQIAAGFVSYSEVIKDPLSGEYTERVSTARLKSSPKTDEMMKIIEQIDVRIEDKVVIWCVFTEEIRMVQERLAAAYGPASVVTFYGAMTDEEKDDARHRLQGDPSCRFFVGNIAVGAMGLTLTAASYEIYHSNSFSYLKRTQSEDRLHRIGQKNAVTVIDIIVKGSADELIYEAIAAKKDVADWITDSIHSARLRQLGLTEC